MEEPDRTGGHPRTSPRPPRHTKPTAPRMIPRRSANAPRRPWHPRRPRKAAAHPRIPRLPRNASQRPCLRVAWTGAALLLRVFAIDVLEPGERLDEDKLPSHTDDRHIVEREQRGLEERGAASVWSSPCPDVFAVGPQSSSTRCRNRRPHRDRRWPELRGERSGDTAQAW